MSAARFEDVEVTDITDGFVATAQAWFDAFAARQGELRPALGAAFDDRQKGRRDLIDAAGEGLLQRLLVSATAP